MLTVFESEREGRRWSVAVKLAEYSPGTGPEAGIQMKMPLEGSKVAPSSVQLLQDNVTESGGALGAVAITAKVSLEPAVTVSGPGTTSEGVRFIFTLMDPVAMEAWQQADA